MDDDIKLPEPSGWVSVYDRMPDTDNQVLVYVPANKYMKVQIDSWSMQREAPLSFSSATIETGFAWDNFEFEDVTHWMPLPAAPHDFAMYTADQLRAAVLADRAERASAADLELPSLAIREGRRCVDRLDGYYDFECEGGPLRMNVEWDILKRSFEHLCRHIERARGIVDQDSKPK